MPIYYLYLLCAVFIVVKYMISTCALRMKIVRRNQQPRFDQTRQPASQARHLHRTPVVLFRVLRDVRFERAKLFAALHEIDDERRHDLRLLSRAVRHRDFIARRQARERGAPPELVGSGSFA